jgi:DNA-binding CsgD family transcriptional regulator
MHTSDSSRKKSGVNKRRAIVLATPEGKIQFADATARRWLKQFFGRPAASGLLPQKLCHWLKRQALPADRSSAVARHQSARLFLKKEKTSTDQTTLLLLELISGKADERARRRRGLTRREGEVLFWVTHSKSNREIGEILGIKPATVSKHLERIYPKLGVETRTAAANLYLQDRQSA